MAGRTDLLGSYKQLLRALVKSNKRSKISQLLEDNKKQVALLTYKKINLIRENQTTDPQARSKTTAQLYQLNKKLELLKKNDPSKSKHLHFYEDAHQLKKMIVQAEPADESITEKRLQHFRDIAGFMQNQMEFEQLVERYNPGLRMDQEEKVKRTAAKVGLQVPG